MNKAIPIWFCNTSLFLVINIEQYSKLGPLFVHILVFEGMIFELRRCFKFPEKNGRKKKRIIMTEIPHEIVIIKRKPNVDWRMVVNIYTIRLTLFFYTQTSILYVNL